MLETVDLETGEISSGPGRMPAPIAAAIIKVMGGARQLGFDEKNQHGGYSYVSIDKFLDAFRPLMAEAGIMLVVDEGEPGYRDGPPNREGKITSWLMQSYSVWLIHESGVTWGPLRRNLALPMTGPQTFGAAESYVQKRLLRTLFMVPTGDKDADSVAPEEEGAPRATRVNPAVAPLTDQAQLARAAVQRIRREIAHAHFVEELDARGINGPAAAEDARMILAQTGGGPVWDDLVRRDAERRVELRPPEEQNPAVHDAEGTPDTVAQDSGVRQDRPQEDKDGSPGPSGGATPRSRSLAARTAEFDSADAGSSPAATATLRSLAVSTREGARKGTTDWTGTAQGMMALIAELTDPADTAPTGRFKQDNRKTLDTMRISDMNAWSTVEHRLRDRDRQLRQGTA